MDSAILNVEDIEGPPELSGQVWTDLATLQRSLFLHHLNSEGLQISNSERGFFMDSIQDILKRCQDIQAQSISPIASVELALEKMDAHDLGALLVMDFSHLVGIFSERDYARKILLKGKSSLTTPVYEVMTTNLIEANPSYSLTECLSLMFSCRVRHLPIIKDGKVIALLGIEDVAFALIDRNEFEIEELTTYITGSHDFKNEAISIEQIFETVAHH